MAIASFLKGIIIGVAAIIPGVSGSVFAVITGVYDELIYFMGRLTKDFRRAALSLLPIASGAAAGVLLGANPILELCEKYPVYCYSFFIGVMLASILPSIRKIKQLGKPAFFEIGVALLCFCFVILLRVIAHMSGAGEFVSIPYLSGISDFFALLFSGFISVGLMTLPGVSGSVILLVLGQYGTVYKAAGSPARLVRAIIEGEQSSASAALGSAALLIPFSVGAVMGVFFSSKLISKLIQERPKSVYCSVIGFVAASIVTLGLDCLIPAAKNYIGNGYFIYFMILAFTLSGSFLTLAFCSDKS